MARGHQQQHREDPVSSRPRRGTDLIVPTSDHDFYRLLTAAVRYDASLQDESILKYPLEEGRIYYRGGAVQRQTPDDEFSLAIQILRRHELQTARPPRFRSSKRRKSSLPRKPITPTILSRLCSYASKTTTPEKEDKKQQSASKIKVTAPELVLYTEALRSRAWLQLRRQKRRIRFVQYVVVPCLSLFFVLSLFRKRMVHADQLIQALNYQTGLCDNMTNHEQACHFSDAAVFPVLVSASQFQSPATFAMHLRLRNETVDLKDIRGGSSDTSANRQHSFYDKNLGGTETVVNQLMRQSIIQYSEKFKIDQDENILDLGCGLGATLYSLIALVLERPPVQSTALISRNKPRKQPQLRYTGIALGSLEIENALKLFQKYFSDSKQVFAKFSVRNFALPAQELDLPSKTYSTVLAIESLSYLDAATLPKLLQQIHNSLQKDGLFLLVDDVVLHKDPLDADIRRRQQSNAVRMQLFRQAFLRPSLLYHEDWMQAFQTAGFTVLEAKDLTLEFELIPDAEDEALLFSSNLVTKFYVKVVRTLLDQYRKWMVELLMVWLKVWPGQTESVSWMQMLLLQTGSTASIRGAALRKQAYWDAELGYNFYVLKKR